MSVQSAPDLDKFFTDLPCLEGERVCLRPLQLTDAEAVYAYGQDINVARYTSWPQHESIEDAKRFLHRVTESYRAGEPSPWGVCIKNSSDGRVIGTAGFLNWNRPHARAEIGFALDKSFWGQGFTTESVRLIIRFGFETMGLNRIEGLCMVANRSSARVMEKAGMTYEGILRSHQRVAITKEDSRYQDMKIYSILRSDWEAAKPG
ncbi:MAG: GNAT family protein [Sumerlaeia bacterium]